MWRACLKINFVKVNRFEISNGSRPGKGKANEDAYKVKNLPDGSLLCIVADGMGGTDLPLVAAEITVEKISSPERIEDAEADLKNALLVANDAICEESIRLDCSMGCAVAAILICGDTLYYSSVGNVRVYVTSVDGNQRQVTEDDICKAENGNVYLTASLSGKEIAPEVDSISLDGIDSVLVCTDGYYNNDEEDDSTWVKIKLNTIWQT